ncbi:MAG: hypothetical protein IT165_09865 [Bryobacterales bacterium]|nr:hypothetical protein [Bryobacterales bacterium]
MQNPQYNVFGQGIGVQTMGKFAPGDLEHSAAAVRSVASGGTPDHAHLGPDGSGLMASV